MVASSIWTGFADAEASAVDRDAAWLHAQSTSSAAEKKKEGASGAGARGALVGIPRPLSHGGVAVNPSVAPTRILMSLSYFNVAFPRR
jgi:hypothetical protein